MSKEYIEEPPGYEFPKMDPDPVEPLDLSAIKDYKPDTSKISDGYHTFGELYHQRAIILAAVASFAPEICWYSAEHHPEDAPMFKGFFIFGFNLPMEGEIHQCNFHLEEKYWSLFTLTDAAQLPHADEWDNHTPEEGILKLECWLEARQQDGGGQ